MASGGRRRRCVADSGGLAYRDSQLTERALNQKQQNSVGTSKSLSGFAATCLSKARKGAQGNPLAEDPTQRQSFEVPLMGSDAFRSKALTHREP